MKLSKFSPSNEEARWFPYSEGVRFLLKYAGGKKYNDAAANISRPHRRAVERGDVRVQREISARTLAWHSMMGWDGIEDDDGNPIPFTHEVAFQALMEHDQLFVDVGRIATEVSNFQDTDDEDTEGNSEAA